MGSMPGVWHRTSSSKPKCSHTPFAPQLLASPQLCPCPVQAAKHPWNLERWHCRLLASLKSHFSISNSSTNALSFLTMAPACPHST